MADWVIDVIGRLGYFGITLLMLAENLFPPLPSELIMPFAGFLAARGELHPVLVVVAGTFGSLLGAIPWYILGRRVGAGRLKRLAQRHGRWIALTPDEIDRGTRLFEKRGPLVLVFGRLVPALRTALFAPTLLGVLRVRGVRLVATDIGWTFGRGPEVRGKAEAILMAMAGRRGAAAELSGPGQTRVARRLCG